MIEYVIGDATQPIGEGRKLIAHICNDYGAWGAGFVLALSRQWPHVEEQYRRWEQRANAYRLGEVQFAAATREITVANMIAQHGMSQTNGRMPIRYWALRKALMNVAEYVGDDRGLSVHMPRIGTGLAGGHWDEVEPIINDTLVLNHQIKVTVYDLPGRE